MSQHHLSIRAAAILAASASALAPVTDLIAKRRRRRRDNDEDDDDDKLGKRRRQRDDDNDNDDERGGIRSSRRSRQDADEAGDGDSGRKTSGAKRDSDSTENDDADDDTGVGAGRDSVVSGRQSIAGDLDVQGIIQDRLDNAFAGRGDGGGNDEPNIIVSEEGDTLVALTNDIDFAGDSTGFEVDTGGISYSSDSFSGDAGGDIGRDFTS